MHPLSTTSRQVVHDYLGRIPGFLTNPTDAAADVLLYIRFQTIRHKGTDAAYCVTIVTLCCKAPLLYVSGETTSVAKHTFCKERNANRFSRRKAYVNARPTNKKMMKI